MKAILQSFFKYLKSRPTGETIYSILTSLTALVAVIIAVLDMFGLLPNDPQTIQSILLILLGFIGLDIIIDRYTAYKEINDIHHDLKDPIPLRQHLTDLNNQVSELDHELKDLIPLTQQLTSLSNHFTELENKYSRVNAFFSTTVGDDDIFHNLLLKYGVRNLGTLQSDQSLTVVGREKILKLWRECILNSDNWYAVSYASDAWGVGQGFSDNRSDLCQQASLLMGGEIKRLFILDDENEFLTLRNIIEEQRKWGKKIEVKYLFRSKLNGAPGIKKNEKDIEDNQLQDFGLVDNRTWVFRFILGKEREIIAGNITNKKDVVHLANYVFDEAFFIGKYLNDTPSGESAGL